MNERAVVIVSFGSTVTSMREKTLDAFEAKVREAYPEYDVFQAFTSRIVTQRVRENEGIRPLTEKGAMYHLAAQGYKEVILQPLHIIPGAEYDKVVQLVEKWKNERIFRRIALGRPLLRFIGQEGERPDDFALFLDTIRADAPDVPGEGLLLVGHGTIHQSQAMYSALHLKARELGLDNVWVGTLEGFPEWSSWLQEMQYVGIRKIHLKPFFFMAGDHVINDIFGAEEDSVANVLRSKGFEVAEDHRGLGEQAEVQALYLEHLKDAVADRYTRRPAHRPVIPKVI